MQNLVPGFQLTDNLLLTEQLPTPPGAYYSVWYALNVQLGKIVVVKIHPDKRIEVIGDSVVNKPVAARPSATAYRVKKEARLNPKKSFGILWPALTAVLFLLILSAAAYWYYLRPVETNQNPVSNQIPGPDSSLNPKTVWTPAVEDSLENDSYDTTAVTTMEIPKTASSAPDQGKSSSAAKPKVLNRQKLNQSKKADSDIYVNDKNL